MVRTNIGISKCNNLGDTFVCSTDCPDFGNSVAKSGNETQTSLICLFLPIGVCIMTLDQVNPERAIDEKPDTHVPTRTADRSRQLV